METYTLFDRIKWRDPMSEVPLQAIISARAPSGVPICGAFRIDGTCEGYPIVDCVARMTVGLARNHREWLSPFSLKPPKASSGDEDSVFQAESSVENFGWQWQWTSNMRSEVDLRMRVAERFRMDPSTLQGKVVLDAGAGAGDQSRYFVQNGAAVVSIDLSTSIDVVARKLRMGPGWVGVQGDVTALPFCDRQFDIVYCEGVLQHTRDSAASVRELCRVAKVGGSILASHYVRPEAKSVGQVLRRKITLTYYNLLRDHLSRMELYKLLLLTGNLAALSYLPALGRLLRMSGTALYYDLMPDFKTTWTNTFDYYGRHTFQRFVAPEEFWSWFEDRGDIEVVVRDTGVIVAKKTS